MQDNAPTDVREQTFPFFEESSPQTEPSLTSDSAAGGPAVVQLELFGMTTGPIVDSASPKPAWADFLREPPGKKSPSSVPSPAGGPAARFAAVGSLDELRVLAQDCRACPLRDGCRGVVFGEGDPAAKLMLIGEGPGAVEDELGRPFVGPAGQLLNRILSAAGFEREEVYITNVVMCRPPDNRVPAPAEVEACFPFLARKIELIHPEVIVSLGATSLQALLGTGARITRLRGKWLEYRGIALMPTFHPAALLRDPTKKRPVWEDFQAVAARLGRRPVSSQTPG